MQKVFSPVIIDLQPEWFRHAYYVYFVSLIEENKRLVYVGMTGDRKHKMARSPFYRMAGHFNQLTSSTENQIIKGVRHIYGIDGTNQQALVEKLEMLDITYYAYPLSPFDFAATTESHTALRRHAERTESWIIEALKEEDAIDSNLSLLNKKISHKPDEEAATIGSQILSDWKERAGF